MKTLFELIVGDKVVVDGGHWSSKPYIATVEKTTPAKVTVGGVVYSRSTGLGPKLEGRSSFGESRKHISVASEEDIANAKAAKQRQRYIALIRARDLDALDNEVLEAILRLMGPPSNEAILPPKGGA